MPSRNDSASSSDTFAGITGLDVIKAIWRISDDDTPHDVPPDDVSTDIYDVPATARRIPHRSRAPR